MRVMEDVYKLCTSQPVGHAGTLYRALGGLLCGRARQIQRELRLLHGPDRLAAYLQRWARWRLGVLYINALCSYLNSNWVRKSAASAERRRAAIAASMSADVPTAAASSLTSSSSDQSSTAGFGSVPSIQETIRKLCPGSSGGGGGGQEHGRRAGAPPPIKSRRKGGKKRSTAAAASSSSASLSVAVSSNGASSTPSPSRILDDVQFSLIHAIPMDVDVLGLLAWQHLVWAPEHEVLVGAALDLVERHRAGEQVDLAPVAGLADSCVKLGAPQRDSPKRLYMHWFERPFVERACVSFARESAAWLAEHGVSAYLDRAKRRLSDEHARAKRILDPESLRPLSLAFDEHYLLAHAERVLAECPRYLAGQHTEQLAQAYLLLGRLPGKLEPLAKAMEHHVVTIASAAISAANDGNKKETTAAAARPMDPRPFVDALLEVDRSVGELVSQAFNEAPLFTGAVDRALTEVINERQEQQNSAAELLAKYCNLLLRKGAQSRLMDEGQLEQRLGRVVALFSHVRDKDVFQKFYTTGLARRLIDQTSVSDDAERLMLSALKQACGFEFVSKLQRMFNDVATSNDIAHEFKKYQEERQEGKEDQGEEGEEDVLEEKQGAKILPCSVLVLTSSAWPIGSRALGPFIVPAQLARCKTRFERFYHERHSGRKLSWLHSSMCKADVRAHCFGKRAYEFTVTDFQLSILLSFNGAATDSLSFDALLNSTGLTGDTLRKVLQPLEESNVLIRSEPESVRLNSQFVSKRLRVNLTGRVARAEAPAATRATLAAIDKDRQMVIQATIVRIAKARRRIAHQVLIAEVIAQTKVRFMPTIAGIKKAIDSLIESEYICRSKSEINIYEYMA